MMNYSRQDLMSLIKYLKSFGDTYEFVRQFFLSHFFRLQVTGLVEPSAGGGSAYVIEQMKELFPDVYFALSMPEKDLPLYMNQGIGQEYPIVAWRLQRSSVSEDPTSVGLIP